MGNILIVIVVLIFISIKTGFTVLQIFFFSAILIAVISGIAILSSITPKKYDNLFHGKYDEDYFYFHNNTLEVLRRSDKIVNKFKVGLTLEQLEKQYIDKLIDIDNMSEAFLKSHDDESIREFKRKKKNTYLSIYKKLKQNYKTSFIAKFFTVQNDICLEIFQAYGKAIKEYYASPYIENINFDIDKQELSSILKFGSLTNYSKDVLFKKVTPFHAKQIIENKNYSVIVIFKTDMNDVYVKDVFLLLSNDDKIQGVLSSKESKKASEDKIKNINSNQDFQKNTIDVHQNNGLELSNDSANKIIEKSLAQPDEITIQNKIINQLKDEVETIKNSGTNNQAVENYKAQIDNFKETVSSQSNEIKELQSKLIKKEQDTNDLMNEFTSKINKLEEKIAKQKVVKTQIPLNIPTEKQSIKKDDGVIVKRDSFDDF